jgi:hypothetical protein
MRLDDGKVRLTDAPGIGYETIPGLFELLRF